MMCQRATGPLRAHRETAGFTFIEVMFALVVLALAATTVMQGIAMSSHAVRQGEETAVALEAARSLRERIAATPLAEVVATWGAGGTEGETFTVEGLDGIAAGQGRIRIVTNEQDTDPDLKAAFGLPRDLDGDGATTSTNVATSARVLPVLIEITWGRGANQRLTMPVVVSP